MAEQVECGAATSILISGYNDLVGKVTSPSQKLLVGLGDSITEQDYSFFYAFARASGGQILAYNNQGIGGNTSAQVLARVGDVPAEADVVTLMCTTNDISMGFTVEQHTTNIIAIVNALHAKGHEVVALLAPPRDDDVGLATKTDEFNKQDYITYLKLGVKCFNPWRLMINPLNGAWEPDKSYDGIHPNPNGALEAGNLVWDGYSKNSFAQLQPSINTQGINNNCAMLDSFGGTIKPVNWNLAAAVTSSTLVPSEGIIGNQWECQFSDVYNDMTSSRFPLEFGKVYLAVITYEHTTISGVPKFSAYWESDLSKRRYIFTSTTGLVAEDQPRTTFSTFIKLNDVDGQGQESNMRFRVKVDAGTWEANIKLSEMQIFDVTALGWDHPLPENA